MCIRDRGLAANYLEDVSAAVSADLESWRKAWEAGRLDDYMGFYAADAVQQGRWGAKNIRRQKETLWARVKPPWCNFPAFAWPWTSTASVRT